MESMSNAPYLLPKARAGMKMGHGEVVDAVIKDGLWDPYGNVHMGICAEKCSRCASIAERARQRRAHAGCNCALTVRSLRRDHGIGRAAQDAHAAESYARASAALASGAFADELVAVEVASSRKGAPPTRVTVDESAAKGGDAASLAKCVCAARARAALPPALTRRYTQALACLSAHGRHRDGRQRVGRV